MKTKVPYGMKDYTIHGTELEPFIFIIKFTSTADCRSLFTGTKRWNGYG